MDGLRSERPRTKPRRSVGERRAELRRSRLRGADVPSAGFWRVLREWQRAAILRVGKESRPWFDGILARYSEVGDVGYPDPACFPWVKQLEAKTAIIQQELQILLQNTDQLPELSKLSPDHNRIATDKWKAFFLMGYGNRAELGSRLCPQTMRALESVPNLESAFFSILMPGMHIRKHRGPTKSLLVCHLGLKVPADREKCRIRVGDEIRSWEEGKVLILDDTFQHEVWNDTDEVRVVLLIHVRRPLRFPGSLVGSFIFNAIRKSPFVEDGRKNVAEWERQFQRDSNGPTATPGA